MDGMRLERSVFAYQLNGQRKRVALPKATLQKPPITRKTIQDIRT